MPTFNTGSTSIDYGATLRIGYRMYGSASAFTYIVNYPSSEELPYTVNLPTAGTYEIEYTQVCPNCSGNRYSEPELVIVTVS